MNSLPTRRDLLSGQALVDPIRNRAASIAARDFVHFSRRAMACEFSVFFPAQHPHEQLERCQHALGALDLIEQLEAQLSIYRDDSEVSRLNQTAASGPVVVEAQLYKLLRRAAELSTTTEGAFDITAGPLSKVWGFQQRQPQLPTGDQIQAALDAVGSSKLAFDDAAQSVRFANDHLEINLGAIGKGYALDRCGAELTANSESAFLLQGGRSSILAVNNENSAAWQIDLRHPFGDRQPIARLQLDNIAMATSGDSVQRILIEDKVYGHIIDPRTGWPAQGIVSATAFAPSAADADALATAFYLMGSEETVEFCERQQDVGAILVVGADDEDFDVVTAGQLPEFSGP